MELGIPAAVAGLNSAVAQYRRVFSTVLPSLAEGLHSSFVQGPWMHSPVAACITEVQKWCCFPLVRRHVVCGFRCA